MSSSEALAIVSLFFIQVITKEDQLFLFFFQRFYYLTKVNWFLSCMFFFLYSPVSTSILRWQSEVTLEVCFETPIGTSF